MYDKNESTLESEIFDLIELIFRTDLGTDKDRKMIADWLLQTDEDLVLYALRMVTDDFFLMDNMLDSLPCTIS
jgi:hypothetical protein